MALVVAGFAISAAAAALVTRSFTQVMPPEIAGLPEPGAVVSVGRSVLRALSAVAGVTTTAYLVLSLASGQSGRSGELSAEGRRDARRASTAAAAWTLVCLGQGLWAFADIIGRPIPNAWSPNLLATFAWDIPQVRGFVLMALLTSATAAIARSSTRVVGVGAALVLTLASGLIPTISGHGSTSSAHALLLAASSAHAVSATVWMALVLAVTIQAIRAPADFRSTAARLSKVAVAAAVALGLSGVGSAIAQVGSIDDLVGTAYGRSVLLKVLLLATAAVAGYVGVRLSTRADSTGGPSTTRRRAVAAGAQIAALAVGLGVGSALASSAPPREPTQFATFAESLVGYTFPPPPTPFEVALTFRPDPTFLVIGLASIVLYLAAVVRLRRRGDRWPVGRTLSWLAGTAVFLWATNAGIAAYANVAVGLHMGQHMALTMLIPVLLVMGAPATLALRALKPRPKESWGPREWLVYLLHSPVAVVLTNPLFVMVAYFAGLYGLYMSSLFGTLMGSHVGHIAMQVHFVVSGYLFYWILIGIDPRPRTLPYWQRFMLLIISSAFHAFFAVAIMMSEQPVAADWFSLVKPPWVTNLLEDTVLGGQAAWAIGEFPMAIVAIALAVQWARSDERDARRHDRSEALHGDRDHIAYNAYLAGLNAGPRARAAARPPLTAAEGGDAGDG